MRGLILVITCFIMFINHSCTPKSALIVPTSIPLKPSSIDSIIEKRGFKIYQYSVALGIAKQALMQQQEIKVPSKHINGWVVVSSSEQLLVRFVWIDDSKVISRYDVKVPYGKKVSIEKIKVIKNNPPTSLCGKHEKIARAQKITGSIGIPSPRCSQLYQVITIPVEEEGNPIHWYMYFIAYSPDSDDVVLGGHHRFGFDADFRMVETKSLSRSCLTMNPHKGEDSGKAAALVATAVNVNEIHSFLSISIDYPLFIIVDNGDSFRVQSGQVVFFKKYSKKDSSGSQE